MELIELVQNQRRLADRNRLHAVLAQDRFGEQGLRAVILDDHDAIGIGILGDLQLAHARQHLVGSLRFDHEDIAARAHGAQARGQINRLCGQRNENDALLAARACRLHQCTDFLDDGAVRAAQHDQRRRKAAQGDLEAIHAAHAIEHIPFRAQLQVNVAGQRGVITQMTGQIVDIGDFGGRRFRCGIFGDRMQGAACGFDGRLGCRGRRWCLDGCRRRCRCFLPGRGRALEAYLCNGLARIGELFPVFGRWAGQQRIAVVGLGHLGLQAGPTAGVGVGHGCRVTVFEQGQQQVANVPACILVRDHRRIEQVPKAFGNVLEACRNVRALQNAAGTGQGFGVLGQHQSGIDVPVVLAQLLAATTQCTRPFGNLLDQGFATLVGIVVAGAERVHGSNVPDIRQTSACVRRTALTVGSTRNAFVANESAGMVPPDPVPTIPAPSQNGLTTTRMTMPISSTLGTSLNQRNQRLERRN